MKLPIYAVVSKLEGILVTNSGGQPFTSSSKKLLEMQISNMSSRDHFKIELIEEVPLIEEEDVTTENNSNR